MLRTRTFAQKVGIGVAALMLTTLLVAAVATFALRVVVAEKDQVLAVNVVVLVEAERLSALNERTVSNIRAFVFSPEAHHVDTIQETDSSFAAALANLRTKVQVKDSLRQIDEAGRAREAQRVKIAQIIALKRSDASHEVLESNMRDLQPIRTALRVAVDELVKLEAQHMQDAIATSSAKASSATQFMIGFTLATFAIIVPLAWLFTRSLTRQIGGAVQHISSSSSELQAAANQQATGAKEQATAMSEITTTIKELLSTSRQIAEGAQRVVKIAEDTASAAQSGDQVVHRTQDAVSSIKRQVDLIVTHMLDLGRKSQQIGGILEVINELAEQTNILAINATIEAVGAGETGKRFAVVADEIRKLADRVGGSTKQIRQLIDEIRSAVNTTVMATEGGSKAVDAGTRQFGDVTASLKHIVDLVGTTTDAAREIELSTKQQTSAVEQVNLAVSDVAQATRESEASSQQTLTTSSHLTVLAKELASIVQASRGAIMPHVGSGV